MTVKNGQKQNEKKDGGQESAENAAKAEPASDKAAPKKPAPDKAAPKKPAPDKAAPDKATEDKATEDKATEDKATEDKATEDKATEDKKSLWQRFAESQLGRSIFRHGYEDTPRNRVLQVAANIWLHLHPARVPRHSVRFRYTWCAGGLTFMAFLVTVVTGVVLMFYYRPTAEYAYADIKYLDFDVPFGMIMRNMHRWAAHAMVILVWIHMFRVFMTGSYKPPREFNWVIGVQLLTLTLLLSFTGYLLPWDQLSMWAVTVGTNMARATPVFGHEGPFGPEAGMSARYDARALLLGGSQVGPAALLRFYVLHCIFLPIAASILMIWHFWRVRKDGGISKPL